MEDLKEMKGKVENINLQSSGKLHLEPTIVEKQQTK